MKSNFRSYFIVLSVVLLVLVSACSRQRRERTITVSGAFALYPLMVKWADEYKKLHPEIILDISAGGAGKGMTDALSGMVDMAMCSRNVTDAEVANGAFKIVVARDAVVATMNSENPYATIITAKGLSREQFAGIYVNKSILTWNQLIPGAGNSDISVYTRSDACGAAEMWGKFLGSSQESLAGTGVFGDPGIADAVKNDKMGIGYNNVIYCYDIKSRKPYPGITIIPLDLNDNGIIDPDEDFYGTLDELMEAIKSDKFPTPPARDLYLVTKGKPQKKNLKLFLEWLLNEGQQFVIEAGYVRLNSQIIDNQLNLIK